MTAERTYLDYNATAPLRQEARAAMVGALDVVGNPSSVHAEGRAARALIEDAREKVAALVGALPSEIVFTSGATEASNWVLRRSWRKVAFSDVEHASVRAPCLAADGGLIRLAARTDGSIDLAGIEALPVAGDAASASGGLLAVQMANNETGVIQPVGEIAKVARARGFKVFTDAVQAAGRIPLDVAALGVDYLSLSAHKIGGPKGVGALYVRDRGGDGASLPPMMIGGGQERRRRGGTENVAAIAGFGAAAEAARRDLAGVARLAEMRDRMERKMLRLTPGAVVVGATSPRLCNTTSIALDGTVADRLVILFDLDGLAISAGSACSSGKVGASHVLAAMGLAPRLASGAIRISIGHETSDADIDACVAAWARHAVRRDDAKSNSKSSAQTAASAPRPAARASAGDR